MNASGGHPPRCASRRSNDWSTSTRYRLRRQRRFALSERVASARAALATSDLSGCALRVIDDEDTTSESVRAGGDADPRSLLLRTQRLRTLQLRTARRRSAACLRFRRLRVHRLAARHPGVGEWARRFGFDDGTPQMAYRQTSRTPRACLLPFTTEQVGVATERVLDHYRCVLDAAWQLPPALRTALEAARERACSFSRGRDPVRAHTHPLRRGPDRLTPQLRLVCGAVAHPCLEDIWRA